MTKKWIELLVIGGILAVLTIKLSPVWLSLSPTDPPICPRCERADWTVPILYGKPGQEAMNNAKNGKCVLGGCMVSPDSPKWQCLKCGERWGTADVARQHYSGW